jgi:hypothetical protein
MVMMVPAAHMMVVMMVVLSQLHARASLSTPSIVPL